MIALERLIAWALDGLDEGEADAVEEHLFACGAVPLVFTPSLLRRVEEEGLPVREYEIAPGATVPCSADSRQVYAITRLEAALEDVTRVDVEILGPGGVTMDRVDDAPFDRRLGAVVVAQTGDMVRRTPTMVLHLRLIARSGDGSERELGVYGLSHRADG